MSNTISFRCPSCGSTEFSVASEPKRYEDLDGGVCKGCGRILRDADVKNFARDIALKSIKKGLQGLGR